MVFLRRRGTAEMARRAERIVKRGKDTEKSHSVNQQMDDLPKMKVRISSGKHYRKHQDDLNSGGHFAVDARRKGPIPGNEQNHHSHHKNQNVATENNNR